MVIFTIILVVAIHQSIETTDLGRISQNTCQQISLVYRNQQYHKQQAKFIYLDLNSQKDQNLASFMIDLSFNNQQLFDDRYCNLSYSLQYKQVNSTENYQKLIYERAYQINGTESIIMKSNGLEHQPIFIFKLVVDYQNDRSLKNNLTSVKICNRISMHTKRIEMDQIYGIMMYYSRFEKYRKYLKIDYLNYEFKTSEYGKVMIKSNDSLGCLNIARFDGVYTFRNGSKKELDMKISNKQQKEIKYQIDRQVFQDLKQLELRIESELVERKEQSIWIVVEHDYEGRGKLFDDQVLGVIILMGVNLLIVLAIVLAICIVRKKKKKKKALLIDSQEFQ